ncbi:fez family zinc finger protein erm-like isoform X2 [Culicoides brevitarsis]|uniref:fez family zinc finger protein erm-like isoform X2 n=1 Tax=Culicoides brevitarsis TaxID=469753 RepID=UPI00307B42D2
MMINETLSNIVNSQASQNSNKNSISVNGQNNESSSWNGSTKGAAGKKRYFCDICGQAVSAFSSIKRHKDAVHFKIKKKFKLRECPVCLKSFFQLAKHMKIKHRDSKVKCTICERVLSCSFSYKRHLKKVHGFFKDSDSSQIAPEPIKITSKDSQDMDYSYPYSHNSSGSKKSSSSSSNSSHNSSSHSYQSPSAAYDPGMMLSRLMVDNTSPMDFKHDWMSYAPPFVPFKKPFATDYTAGASSHSKSTGMMNPAFAHSAFGSPESNAALNSFYPTNYPFYPAAAIDSQRTAGTSANAASAKNEAVKDLSQLLGIEGAVEASYIHPSQVSAGTNSESGANSGGSGPSSNTNASNTNPNAVICSICNHSFRDSSSLRRHTKSKHASKFEQMENSKQQRKKYKCTVCNMHLSCSGSIQRHMRLMHNKVGDQPGQSAASNPDYQYTCSVCQRSFMNEISLQRHFSYHRKSKEVPDGKSSNNTSSNTAPVNTYNTCPPCDRGFENSWSYERHMLTHPNSPHSASNPAGKVCTVCNLWVTTTMSLKRHKKLKHPDVYNREERLRTELDERKKYKCEICDKKIASYSSLQRHHKLVHNPEKKAPYDESKDSLSFRNGFDLSMGSRYPQTSSSSFIRQKFNNF